MSTATPHDPGCIFCRIAGGEVPAYRVHEDGQVVAFLDVGPVSRGHVLVVPRAHYARLEQMPAELAGAWMAVAARVARALGPALGAGQAWAYNVLQNNGAEAGQLVQHVHFHLIPKPADDPGRGLQIGWPAGELDEADAQKLAAGIRQALGG